MQNLRRGHYELATETQQPLRVADGRVRRNSPKRSDKPIAMASSCLSISECNRAREDPLLAYVTVSRPVCLGHVVGVEVGG